MEISKKQILKSIDLGKSKNLFRQLDDVYDKIPGGKCDGCTLCCWESVNTFYIEFLNIYKYMMEKELLDKWFSKIENHYFNELIEKKACPFLDESGKCIIYLVRPLVCRSFGYASKEEHESNYRSVLEMNSEAEAYFLDEFGVKLPSEVVDHKIDYCQSFVPGRAISMDERQDMIDGMFQRDSVFLMADLIPEDAINMSLTNWFIYTKYTEEEASEIRINKLLSKK